MSDETQQPAAPSATPVPAPPAAPVPAGTGGWGPKGETRGWFAVALLTLITCGIYGLFWQYRVFADNKRYSGDGVGGAVGLVLSRRWPYPAPKARTSVGSPARSSSRVVVR